MEAIKQSARSTYHQLDGIFTKKEAWTLYIWVAYAETIGWLLLLFGIFSKIYHWPYADWSIAIGGSTHGLIFIAYVLIVLCAHQSMKWRFREFIAAEVLSNIPFGALAFEQYIVRKRK